MKVGRQYFLGAICPATTVVIAGLIQMPSDCGQCVVLSFVGGGLMFLFLLVLGLSYFLMKIELYDPIQKILLGLLATFTPGILLTIFLFKNYYHSEQHLNSDFKVASPALATTFLIGVWTFYLFVKHSREAVDE